MKENQRTKGLSRWQRLLVKIAASRSGAWFFSRVLHRLDRLTLRLSDGRWMLSQLIGLPLITLTATGARSGQPRSVPLIGVPDGERLIVIASNWGQEHPPAWYHNVRANPEVTVKMDGVSQNYRAREVEGGERARAWAKAVARYPGYRAYQTRTERTIPVLVLEPNKAS